MSSLFGSEYQGGSFVDVLAPQGSNPLSNWKVSGPQKGVQKVYDKDVKGYLFSCSGAGVKLQVPRDDKATLGLLQPHLVLQVSLSQGQALTVELGLTDESNTRRRMVLSSSFADAKSTPLHCQIPFSPVARDAWLNLVLVLSDMVHVMFRGAVFRSLDSLAISGSCRVRRVFTLREAVSGAESADVSLEDGASLSLPRGLEFPPGLITHTQLLGASAIMGPVGAVGGLGRQLSSQQQQPPGSAGQMQVQGQGHGRPAKPPLSVITRPMTVGDSSDEDEPLFARSAGPGSPWAVNTQGRGLDGLHPPTTRLMSRPVVGAVGSPHVQHSPALAAQGRAAIGGAGAGAGSPASAFVGRRAISAQTMLRSDADDALGVVGGAPGGGAGGAGPSDRAAGLMLPLMAVVPHAPGERSPPYGRGAYSHRAQSGPARLSAVALLDSAGSLGSAGLDNVDVANLAPLSPGAAVRHGRRSIVASNIPSTIAEAEPLSSVGRSGSSVAALGSASLGPLPLSGIGSSSGNGRDSSPSRRSRLAPAAPSSGSAAAASALTSAAAKESLGSLLQVKASVDLSLDFSAIKDSPKGSGSGGGGGGGSAFVTGGVQSPFISNMVSLMGSMAFPTRDRYAPPGAPGGGGSGVAMPTQATRPAAPPTSQRPAAPAENTARPRADGVAGPGSAAAGASGTAAAGGPGAGRAGAGPQPRPPQAGGPAAAPGPSAAGPSKAPAQAGQPPQVPVLARGGAGGATVGPTPNASSPQLGMRSQSPGRVPGRREGSGQAGAVANGHAARATSPGRREGGGAASSGGRAPSPSRNTRQPSPRNTSAASGAAAAAGGAAGSGPGSRAGVAQQQQQASPSVGRGAAPAGPAGPAGRPPPPGPTHRASPPQQGQPSPAGASPARQIGGGTGQPGPRAAQQQQQQQLAAQQRRGAPGPSRPPAGSAKLLAAEQHAALLAQRAAHRLVSNASVAEVDEDASLGFGVDDDDVLGSRHFRQLQQQQQEGTSSGFLDEPIADVSEGPSLAPVKVRAPRGLGLLEGIGSPMAQAVASPPIRRVGPDGSPTSLSGGGGGGRAAAAAFGMQGKRPSHDMDDEVLHGDVDGGPSVPAGGAAQQQQNRAGRPPAHPSPPGGQQQQQQHAASRFGNGGAGAGGYGNGNNGDSGHHTNATIDSMLGTSTAADAARAHHQNGFGSGGGGGGGAGMHHHGGAFNGGGFGGYDDEDLLLSPARFKRAVASPRGSGDDDVGWGGALRGDEAVPPLDIGAHQRLYTPPVVPPSKVAAQQRTGQAAQQHPQVLVLGAGPGSGAAAAGAAAGSAAGVRHTGGEEMVDLVYDPVLNCYYDAKTNKYYELKKLAAVAAMRG